MTTTKSILFGTTTDDLVFPITITNDSNVIINNKHIII